MIGQLLDTSALLLFLQGAPGLSKQAIVAIESTERRSYISQASLWELAHKQSFGLTRFPPAVRSDFPDLLKEEGFEILPIEWQTIRLAAALPLHHRDETDRLLIAEAKRRELPLLSIDPVFDQYDIERFS